MVHTVFQLFDKDGEIFHTMCVCVGGGGGGGCVGGGWVGGCVCVFCPQAGPFLYTETCIKRTPSIKRTVAEIPKFISLIFFK